MAAISPYRLYLMQLQTPPDCRARGGAVMLGTAFYLRAGPAAFSFLGRGGDGSLDGAEFRGTPLIMDPKR